MQAAQNASCYSGAYLQITLLRSNLNVFPWSISKVVPAATCFQERLYTLEPGFTQIPEEVL